MENQYFKTFTVEEVQKNRENVLYALQAINKMQNPVFDGVEIIDTGFNMSVDVHTSGKASDFSQRSCGTVACIAGWAMTIASVTYEEMLDKDVDKAEGRVFFHTQSEEFIDILGGAQEFLDLKASVALNLFTPHISNKQKEVYYNWSTNPELFSLEAAVHVMTSLVETGEFSWLEAIKSAESTPANVLAELSEGEWE